MARGLIACVLKSGGDFKPEHVWWLYRQCAEHMPDWDFGVWSDVEIQGLNSKTYQLRYDWPKWWAKFEIYEQWQKTPLLVIDLDTVFVDTLEIRSEHEDEMLIIRDPWKDGGRFPERLGGGFMYLPEWAYNRLNKIRESTGMENLIAEFGGDDQPLLHHTFHEEALRFQDHYIDEIVSYKVHVKGIGLQEDNKVVYFHGKPRPWDIKEPWIPCLYPESSLVQAV